MGGKFIQARYKRVIKSMRINLEGMQAGDMTEIKEDARNLSQSQRRALILARIMYDTADIVILKDFFGHENEENELELYNSLMKGFLKYKTVLIVTHCEHILKKTDKIVYIKR